MKATAMAAILAVTALVGEALLYREVVNLEDQVSSLARRPVSAAERRFPGGERAAGGGMARARGPAARRGEGPPPAAAEQSWDDRRGDRAPAGEGGLSLEERMARLEQEQRRLAAEAARRPVPLPMRPVRVAGTLEQLADTLKLSPPQKARVADAVERGKALIEEVMRIPDETGKSPFERLQERRKHVQEVLVRQGAGEVLTFMHGLLNWRNRRIPGRAETYGQEVDRIKRETRREVESALDKDQRKTFEQTLIDPLLGAPGGSNVQVVFKDVKVDSLAGVEGEEDSGN